MPFAFRTLNRFPLLRLAVPIGSDDHLSVTRKFAKFGRLRRGQRRETPVSVVQFVESKPTTLAICSGPRRKASPIRS